MDATSLFEPQVLKVIGGALTVLVALALIRRLLRTPRADPHHQTVSCRCGWTGSVSRYKPKCPKCAASLEGA